MKNHTLSLLIFILTFSSCSPITTEYLPMKDEVYGVSYVMGLSIRRNVIRITGIDPRKGGVLQTLKYNITSSNVDKRNALKYVNEIVRGDSIVDPDIREAYSKVMEFYTPDLGLVSTMNPCWKPPVPSPKSDSLTNLKPNPDSLSSALAAPGVFWTIARRRGDLKDTHANNMSLFIPKGIYSKVVVGPNGNGVKVNYDFSGTTIIITEEFIFDQD